MLPKMCACGGQAVHMRGMGPSQVRCFDKRENLGGKYGKKSVIHRQEKGSFFVGLQIIIIWQLQVEALHLHLNVLTVYCFFLLLCIVAQGAIITHGESLFNLMSSSSRTGSIGWPPNNSGLLADYMKRWKIEINLFYFIHQVTSGRMLYGIFLLS